MKKTYYLLVVSDPAADVSTVAEADVSGAKVADVSIDSIVAFEVSPALSVEFALSLHATKAPIAKTNKNFFIFELFEFDNNVLLIYTRYDKR